MGVIRRPHTSKGWERDCNGEKQTQLVKKAEEEERRKKTTSDCPS